MKYTEHATNVLASISYKGIGKAWIVNNIRSDMVEESIVSLLNKDAKVDSRIMPADFEKKKNSVRALIAKLDSVMDGVIAIGDDGFPVHRGIVKSSEKPVFLFYKGNLQLLQTSNNNVAVIGLRTPDDSIEDIEKEVVAELVANDVTIVSGLALGCDSIAHKQALDLGGKTVAILPGPLGDILPASNKALALEITRSNGLLVTEYLTDAKSRMELASRYQERDRLQALFSDCVVLSASYAKNDSGNDSGSRFAMQYALDYKIPRAVIYDSGKNINDPKYDLNRQCIEEEKSITIIDRGNVSEAINKILSIKSVIENKLSNTLLINLS